MSIMTNCGLLCVSPPLRRLAPDLSQTAWVLRWVVVEHLLMAVRYVLHQAIPDKPEWVRVALAKLNYQSKQALRKEVSAKPGTWDLKSGAAKLTLRFKFTMMVYNVFFYCNLCCFLCKEGNVFCSSGR